MKLGQKGEGLAVTFLKKRGYRIIKTNFRTKIGEIDIIAADGETLVFVEVKTRESSEFGQPFEAINKYKKKKIANVALLYLKRLKEVPPCRFDVVSVYHVKKGPQIELIKDAFEV